MENLTVCGKGGSEKNTLVTLLWQFICINNKVLVVDTDESNLGLPARLNIIAPQQTLLDYLGGKPAVRQKAMGTPA